MHDSVTSLHNGESSVMDPTSSEASKPPRVDSTEDTATPSASSAKPAHSASITIKTALVGDPQVGKTTMMVRYVQDRFEPDYTVTLGVDFMEKRISIKTTEIVVSIWDLGGAKEFVSMLPVAVKGAHAVCFCFDLTRISTLHTIKDWYKRVRAINQHAFAFLVGTKFDEYKDMTDAHKDTITKLADKIAHAMKAPLVYVSSGDDINVNTLFKISIAKILGMTPKFTPVMDKDRPIIKF